MNDVEKYAEHHSEAEWGVRHARESAHVFIVCERS